MIAGVNSMDNFGFIHEELDIKILILFILSKLSGPVDFECLTDLCRCDGGVGYFEYADCLGDLIETEHVIQTDEGYRITEKGMRNAAAVSSSLPYSVRVKALEFIEPVEESIRRQAMISSSHQVENGACTVHLGLSDDAGSILKLSFLCPGEEQATAIEKKFRKDAENYYSKIIELFGEL